MTQEIKPLTYYNEFDKKKCAALKELMADGLISTGDIDDRPIQEVKRHELQGYTRCHFFAGIGLWDYALNLAGWSASRPVWTGSCPCQPFSSAGRQKGKADDRHLLPYWQRLIEECSPATIFGEQVASAVAHGWLDDVYQGLEAQGYAVGAAVLPACSVGAPHKRDRLWFVAYAEQDGRNGCTESGSIKKSKNQGGMLQSQGSDTSSTVGDPSSQGSQGHRGLEQEPIQERWQGTERHPWQTGVWIDCPDGKQRLVEPRICLLADGYSNRVLQLHCAGDAIVPQVAAKFIQCAF
jgi:DNA (cytosine-5)-methyltransferase 1